ncbi:GL22538 [Drosophila persimilis]|uniref:Neuropeptide-like 4 n=2 Tax=pseudoobscura subgroup TaxID=32358 RepID=B5DP21_DROPS|nr:uncharacterized protein LOC6599476 [Drosophila persimilis]XP_002134645.1 uncharacterized protein LOC6900944 [Drosophila pseudoobscura]EDW30044.1 GL22538 [Drosophila persimilis]
MLFKVLLLALLATLGSDAKPQLLVTSPVNYATVGGGTWLAAAAPSAYFPTYASYPAYASYAYAPVYGAYATYPYYSYLRR